MRGHDLAAHEARGTRGPVPECRLCRVLTVWHIWQGLAERFAIGYRRATTPPPPVDLGPVLTPDVDGVVHVWADADGVVHPFQVDGFWTGHREIRVHTTGPLPVAAPPPPIGRLVRPREVHIAAAHIGGATRYLFTTDRTDREA